MKQFRIYVGFDPRWADAYAVTRESALRWTSTPRPVYGLVLEQLVAKGLYTRPTEYRDGRIFDALSRREDYSGEMSTEFAISRFLVPLLAGQGWALFMDGDMLVRAPLTELFALADRNTDKALMCVQHDHRPAEGATKMGGKAQTQYQRKNWSSLMLFNCDHPATKRLTIQMVNALPGADLHRFCWLRDEEIGALPAEWNYLVGWTKDIEHPRIVHFTEGVPSLAGHEDDEYADEWRAMRARWAA